MNAQFPLTLLVAALVFAGTEQSGAVDLKELDDTLGRVAEFKHGDDSNPMRWLEAAVFTAFNEGEQREEVEAALLRTLDSSRSPAARIFLCKQLRVIGTDRAVPHLAKLLADKDLSHAARYALGSIGSEAALQALTDALDDVKGLAAAGIVNTLADHRHRPAAGKIVALLRASSETETLLACVRAIGVLGDRKAVELLQKQRAKWGDQPRLQVALQTAVLRIAESSLASGKADDADAIYRSLYEHGEDSDLRIVALRGLANVRGRGAAKLLSTAARAEDPEIGRAAAGLLAEAAGDEATRLLLALLPDLTPDRRPAVVVALGRTRDAKVVPELIKLAEGEEAAVRLAALVALGSVGGEKSLLFLARAAATRQDQEQRAAQAGLRNLPGGFDPVHALQSVAKEDAAVQCELIRALSERGESALQPRLVELANHQEPQVRQEAIRALGNLATVATIDPLLEMLNAPGSANLADVEQAVARVVMRSADRAAASAKLLGIGRVLRREIRPVWVRLLGLCPTPETRSAVRKAVRDDDPAIADAAVQSLCAWPNLEAAPDLLALAREPRKKSDRDAALRGYIRLAKDAADHDRMYAEAMRVAESPGEKRLVLGGLANARGVSSLDLAESFLADADLRDAAATAAIGIAERLRDKEPARAKDAAQRILNSGSKDKNARHKAGELLKRR